ncbi:MAG: ABC transporter substrate-binding protein [Firmicutes bacterium]|nr:ABC transporter substrate-binding protein [Bacillota bacterium]
MFRKIVCVTLALCMSLIAIGSVALADRPDEFVKLSIFMPGAQTGRMKDFAENELKDKMLEDLNCELDFFYEDWGQYWNKLGLLLSGGEDIDFFWDGIGALANHYARQEVLPLDDLLEEYGQDLLKNIPIKNFDTARMADGKIYAIPSQAAAASGKFYSVLVRQDLLEGVGMSKIETIADLEQFAELAKDVYPDKVGLVERTMFRPLTRGLTDKNIATWPLNQELFWVDEDDAASTVQSIFDTDFFKAYCELIYSWIQKGYTTEQVMSMAEELDRIWNNGEGLFRVGAVSRPLEEISKLLPTDPDAKLMEYFISPEKPRYIEYASNEAMSIPTYCKDPARVMMYLNWTLASQDNYNFLLFGVEGKDYTIDENGRMNRNVQDDLIYEWMWRNNNYIIYPNTVSDEYIAACETWDTGAPYSKLFGFNFDQESVKVEKAAVEAVYAEFVQPLVFGLIEPTDEAIAQAIDMLNGAGFAEYMAEMNAQIQAHNSK